MSTSRCELGRRLVNWEEAMYAQARELFASDSESVLGLAHSSAAVQYRRAFEIHIRNGCEQCAPTCDDAADLVGSSRRKDIM